MRFVANNTTGMIRQHYDNKKNNSSDSPGSKAERWTEQKMLLNLATPPGASGQQTAADGGMPLSCNLCQSAYPLHIHRTCLHNQPPPPGLDDSGPATENDNSTTGADENPSDNGEEENETTRHSSNNSSIAAKSEPVQQQQHNGVDVPANNSGGGGMNFNAD